MHEEGGTHGTTRPTGLSNCPRSPTPIDPISPLRASGLDWNDVPLHDAALIDRGLATYLLTLQSHHCLGFPPPALRPAMGNCRSSASRRQEAERHAAEMARQAQIAEERSAQRQAMRRNGVVAPPAVMMLGGVIWLTANAEGLFDWLQGRIAREDWRELILSINDEWLGWRASWPPSKLPEIAMLRHQRIKSGAHHEAARARDRWLERDVDLVMHAGADSAAPPTIDLTLVPFAAAPGNNAADLRR